MVVISPACRVKDIVNESLQYQRLGRKAIQHDAVFKVATGCTKGCCPYVALFDAEEVICTLLVQFA